VTDDERERAWGAVHDAIARMPGWAVGPCLYYGEVALWHITAIDLRPRGRYAKREVIESTGATEIDALGALVDLLEARRS
jgi:hypothetical protein